MHTDDRLCYQFDIPQVDRLGSEVAWRHADQILIELEPDVVLMRVWNSACIGCGAACAACLADVYAACRMLPLAKQPPQHFCGG